MTSISNPYQPPSTQVDLASNAAGPKLSDWKDIYFSYQGRIPRKTYWVWGILGMIAFIVAAGILGGLLGLVSESLAWIVLLPTYIIAMWVGFALAVKRWHDRNKSGWWVLIGLVPVIGGIWQLVENGFLRGTVGDNDYGPDPTEN